MKPSRPYIARALYSWLLDCDLTPHIVVDTTQEGVQVPGQFVENGQIVLNIAPGAVQGLIMDDQVIEFSARFSGQPMQVYVPLAALLALYARENGQGMVFGQEPAAEYYLQAAPVAGEPSASERNTETSGRPAKKPTLKVVK
ncbi:ClpXP protease specificity-enhancing factor [Pontibacter sp. JAM-7]|uniref:ClpXP protease specificity-enhancing factor n=1 Tax=Pontibacter sp. JAM-7 TaxID=3366581 RepID=UPI003AF70C5E